MKLKALLLFIIFFPLGLFSQDLRINAVYYDSLNRPFKIEQEYVNNDSSLLYVGLYQNGSNCISIKKINHGDTTIISEGYYLFDNETTPIEEYILKVSGITETVDENNPGVLISNSGYDSSLVIDSIMPLAEIKKYLDPYDIFGSLNKLHIRLLIDGKIKLDPDKRILEETVNTFYLNNQLIKVEWRGKDNQVYGFYVCTTQNRMMTCRTFGLAYKSVEYPADCRTVSWNKDTSKISWIIKDPIQEKDVCFDYCFEGEKLKVYSGNTIVQETEFMKSDNIFKTLIKEGLEDDAFCSSDLLGLTRFKPLKKTYNNGHQCTYLYTFDGENRIIGQKQFYDGKFNIFVTYNYY